MYGVRYGRITGFDPRSAHRADTLGFSRARLVLKAQANVLSLLHGIVLQVLEGSDKDVAHACKKWKEMAEVGFKKTGDSTFWAQYTCQPFSPPPRLGVEALRAQGKARMDAAADHFWLLQTDPSYMHRYIRLIREGVVAKSSSVTETNRVIYAELMWDLSALRFWQCVHDELENLNMWYHRYRDNIFPVNHCL